MTTCSTTSFNHDLQREFQREWDRQHHKMERAIPSRTSGLAGGAGVAGVEATSESSPVGTAIACVSSTTGGAWSAISSESDRDIERSIDLMMCKREGRERTGRKSSLRQSPNDRGSTEEGAHGYKNVDFVIGARSLLRCFASLSLRTHTHSLAAALVQQLLRTVPPSVSLASRQLFLSFVSLSSNVATRCVLSHAFSLSRSRQRCRVRGKRYVPTHPRTSLPIISVVVWDCSCSLPDTTRRSDSPIACTCVRL